MRGLITGMCLVYFCGTSETTQINRVAAPGTGRSQGKVSILHVPAPVLQNLIVCNGYAWSEPIDIFHTRMSQKLTANRPLPYKECREMLVPLHEHDQLEFHTHQVSVGIFHVRGILHKNLSLLLIPHRRHHTLKASFASHAFADLPSAQIAVIDVYNGRDHSSVQIMDDEGSAKNEKNTPRSEKLRFNSAVAVTPGRYKVMLTSTNSGNITSGRLSVPKMSKCVAVRMGDEDHVNKTGYPAELVLFQQASTFSSATRVLFGLLPAMIVLTSTLVD